jgi:hypothetical protein
MSAPGHWLFAEESNIDPSVDGLVPVAGFRQRGLPPEQFLFLEKAESYGAHSVFFEAARNGTASVAQAFIFVSDGGADDPDFANLYRRLWSWGGVPLVYRKTPGLVQLFRCAHKPDFESKDGTIVCYPFKTLKLSATISSAPWWDANRLRNGTLWDDPKVCGDLLSANHSAQKALIDEVKRLNDDLEKEALLPKPLRRKLLILCLLIAYLEERGVFEVDFFSKFVPGARRFFEVLANGPALVDLLENMEGRFNGHVFTLEEADRERLRTSGQLHRFARMVEGRREASGQFTLWQRYSFRDLPIELISHIYQLFVENTNSSIYTPPFLVRLMLDEAMSWERLDRLEQQKAVILDPCCGSGVFLVEAYKRLVIHWRSRNGWRKPGIQVLKGLLKKVHGIDLEQGAVELAAFSLCLALCDALEPEEIRSSVRLFPPLAGKTLHHSCFFDAKDKALLSEPVGIVVGNPPFESHLSTDGARQAYEQYEATYGPLPDKQLAYLFLHSAMEMVSEGGMLCLLQQYNFLYNQQSLCFRRTFIEHWDVREILDFISVRGLFQKGGADTKVLVVVAEANQPPPERQILHATFRRSGRTDAEQGFDIDYYDMHWLPRDLALTNDAVWRCNLFGGGRVLSFVDRLNRFRTLGDYAKEQDWDYGEGFIYGNPDDARPADHVVGKRLLPPTDLNSGEIQPKTFSTVPDRPIQWPRRREIYTPPLLLIRKHMDIHHGLWRRGYLTYQHQIMGFSAARANPENLGKVAKWLDSARKPLLAYVATTSDAGLVGKATAILSNDILSLPYPASKTLDLSSNEEILIDDIVDYYRDLIRLGGKSTAMRLNSQSALPAFASVFTRQINAIYKKNPLTALEPQTWPGIICQPFVFGNAAVDWSGTEELKSKLDTLLHEQKGSSLHIIRIARIYDGNAIYLLKPDRLRFWLRSVALRDADETQSDLLAQGF